MTKMMKKMSAIFAGVLLISTLAACSSFDASAYVKAILDNSYHNDSTTFVEQGVGTAEEAAEIYEQGMNANMDIMDATVVLSDGLRAEFLQFYKDLYNSAKYTVGEAVEVDDTTYEVTVTYEQLQMFAAADEAFAAKSEELVVAWGEAAAAGEVPTEDEMNEQLFAVYKDCLVAALAEATYAAPATTVIRVELIDNVWTPNSDDLLNLEGLLFDFVL